MKIQGKTNLLAQKYSYGSFSVFLVYVLSLSPTFPSYTYVVRVRVCLCVRLRLRYTKLEFETLKRFMTSGRCRIYNSPINYQITHILSSLFFNVPFQLTYVLRYETLHTRNGCNIHIVLYFLTLKFVI